MYPSLRKIILAFFFSFQLVAFSVPANPKPRVTQQADGSFITIIVRGDEHGHLTMTTDGYPLFYNDSTQNYEYAVLSDGMLVGSGIVAADAESRTEEAVAFLKGLDVDATKTSMVTKRMNRLARKSSGNTMQRARMSDIPCTGEQRSLVILINFNDCEFSSVGDDPNAFYTRMLNEEGFTYSNGANGSARDYYIASSSGQYLPTFDVAGPVTLSQSYSYYGKNDSQGYDYTARLVSMVKEACTLVDDEIDFSLYDTNNDGEVDNIFFFYAGYGEADSGKKSTIWPHSALFKDDFKAILILDGKYINSYACSNELNATRIKSPCGIGTFVHEFGHVLGLPDIYDVNYNSGKTFTPGYYDIMDEGEYCNDGNTPPLFSAYERGEMGWIDFTELSSTDGNQTLTLPELSSSNMAYRLSVEGTNGDEYYILENRQQTGWDAYLPGHGLLMWHIDYDYTSWKNNTVNTSGSHQRIDIVEADDTRNSYSTSGDTFPGKYDVTQWAMEAWDGTELLTINDIKEEDETIYFTTSWPSLGIGDVFGEVQSNSPIKIYDLNGRRYTSFEDVPYGLYFVKQGGRVVKKVK